MSLDFSIVAFSVVTGSQIKKLPRDFNTIKGHEHSQSTALLGHGLDQECSALDVVVPSLFHGDFAHSSILSRKKNKHIESASVSVMYKF